MSSEFIEQIKAAANQPGQAMSFDEAMVWLRSL
ncbi:hypothetical protein FHT02_004430 [Sphingomonas xinjiangensis]|uniref:Uncharacterized protein n=2 Tax=Sphingomonas xinjiangensis TaxID=643568 RepID=A0A840YU06_9SPHN|nr:hypothetical protein [Sphingomonas xinjiangensis]